MTTSRYTQHLQHCVPWRGQTCVVRPFVSADAPALYAFARLQSTSWHMSWEPHGSVEETAGYIASVVKMYGNDCEAPLCIATQDTDACCGFVGFTHFEPQHLRSDIAIALHPDFAGRGIAQEACSFMLRQAQSMGLLRVQAVVEAKNTASRRLMERLGLTEECLLRQYLVSKGGSVDAFLYATIFDEHRVPPRAAAKSPQP